MKRNSSRKAKAVRKTVTALKSDKKTKGFRTGIKAGQFGIGNF